MCRIIYCYVVWGENNPVVYRVVGIKKELDGRTFHDDEYKRQNGKHRNQQ